MSRYIKTDEAIESLYKYDFVSKHTIEEEIQAIPSIDLVFCEECRECVEKGTGVDCPSGYGYLYCTRKKSVVDEDDYCSWGVRR